MPQPGDKAPEVALHDQDGKVHSLGEYSGSWVLLYFYPKDDTPGCTKEACDIRDYWAEFKNAGIVVLGVSKDSSESHKKFKDKYQLPFTLLADTDGAVVERYGVWKEKNMMGKKFMGIERTSFLINPEGVIERVYEKVKPETHAEIILRDVRTLI